MNSATTLKKKQTILTELSNGDFDAFLYDCDGTLADNMEGHKASYRAAALMYGFELDDTIIDELAGWPIIQVAEEIRKKYGASYNPEVFAQLKNMLYEDTFIQETKPIDFVVAHLKAHAGRVRIGVVSGGSQVSVSRTLQQLGITKLVEVLVCAGDTARGKPYPDPFLYAAKQLGVAPTRCLVFEDGNPGVQAAVAAGMQWIRIDHV
ncbi:HAD-superfamily hydrolase, subfamily IA, variant 3 [Niastella koreensis GR20-10]|uniref:HAD-superfamily hydrolase, subfamily IA, variant 3 n=1 Tax=Niastella koreensis (strain DSM 17620 / KACC 11465 / NBRC 106392 / GR20-10) TaxID=700598 RepID=G8TLR3_NIAKG|nr:HAD family phosphatase [Niastella koreensis]AEV97655.1 HAD-superfamily hydrolase, subfamily IA, variant 3 [Niastella koreensis GR20-10]